MAVYLSHVVSEGTPLYGDRGQVIIYSSTAIDKKDTANTLNISLPNHSGTHVDVPYHFFNNGKKLTDYDPSFWIFNNPVCVDVPSESGELINFSDIYQKLTSDVDLLLIRTGFERYRMAPDYWNSNPGLSADLAHGIRENFPNVRAIGIDCISITSYLHRSEGKIAHRAFLGRMDNTVPLVLIEDMSLLHFDDNINTVIVLPIIISGADGAPATIIGI